VASGSKCPLSMHGHHGPGHPEGRISTHPGRSPQSPWRAASGSGAGRASPCEMATRPDRTDGTAEGPQATGQWQRPDRLCLLQPQHQLSGIPSSPPCDACSYVYSPPAVENTLIWVTVLGRVIGRKCRARRLFQRLLPKRPTPLMCAFLNRVRRYIHHGITTSTRMPLAYDGILRSISSRDST
jgi:hypothetical protein